MSIALTDSHRELEAVVDSFLLARGALELSRKLLDEDAEELPTFWAEIAELGWLGLHIDEAYGGSGYGLPELIVVVERFGRVVAPGPFVPTVAASAGIAAAGWGAQRDQWLPPLVRGDRTGAIGWGGDVRIQDSVATGEIPAVIGGGVADLLVLIVGEDVVVVERSSAGVDVVVPDNADRSRRAARIVLNDAPVELIANAAPPVRSLARTIFAAEACGGARACTDAAVAYAKTRVQFGRTIGTFQAVKHHCANMLVASELATAATWDAARAAERGAEQFDLASAAAAVLAVPAFLDNSHLNIQIHGGVGFTWEHDAHRYMRRALALSAVFGDDCAGHDLVKLSRHGIRRSPGLDLPTEAQAIRADVRGAAQEIAALPAEEQRARVIADGYAMPHWPAPYGRDAGAVEQLLIEEEFAAAGVQRPVYGITGWVILTLIQHGTPDQVERWVLPALLQDEVWCQLFSEPDAGSDAAAVRTSARRVAGGWVLNGQKVWTSGAREAAFGLATVRTDPVAPKRGGISTMVIEMDAEGVEIRPLRQITGDVHFNEVFLSDVFVPDDHVIGAVHDGWTVARATFGNERVSIGSGAGGGTGSRTDVVALLDAHPDHAPGVAPDAAAYLATSQALRLLNLRRAERAISGAAPGPEGNITKLVLAEQGHALASIALRLVGSRGAYLEGPGAVAARKTLSTRGMSIAGGTSEITRNQIAERVLGLPRDPLVD